jgi:hypothetical protein
MRILWSKWGSENVVTSNILPISWISLIAHDKQTTRVANKAFSEILLELPFRKYSHCENIARQRWIRRGRSKVNDLQLKLIFYILLSTSSTQLFVYLIWGCLKCLRARALTFFGEMIRLLKTNNCSTRPTVNVSTQRKLKSSLFLSFSL